ncbi:molybdate ABC transporter substrate-binding protein [Desulfotomaculum copahuensis]|uniref:Molybdate ABC transporter substrate-binding protein n=1 Tax=Desulfotomaculum copahuensis TaxID=1838280 RepID=A0A1B7LEV9_9FIRM|nr:molybdate ABC transporter substrate-binding protein [Desulfotomaculum copahuensis]OAT81829.1 molybdate ABC transporter substrate-binding protein [Desulfotomaculum copahuensis]
MKKLAAGVLLLFLVAALAAGCGQTPGKSGRGAGAQKEVTVSAAISLKDALGKIKADYEKAHPDVKITYNLGASGALQQQIEQGAPVDLFISAGASQMDQLAKEGLIDPATRVNLLSNDLVLVTPQNGPQIKDFSALAGPAVKKIGLGLPKTVPAGKYAQETLDSLKLWDKLQPKLVTANDVRQVLTYVETGNVDAGFVYRSDAMMGKNIKVALTVPDNLHKPIVYPAAVVKNARQKDVAREFLNYLASPPGMQVFEQYGLKPGKK